MELGILKYTVFAVMAVLLIFNYSFKAVFEKFSGRELDLTKTVAIKSACYVAMLSGAVYIIFG